MRVPKHEIALSLESDYGFRIGSTAFTYYGLISMRVLSGLVIWEALAIYTGLCDSLQERHEYKTVRCATALTVIITAYKGHDSGGSLDLKNHPV